MKAWLSVCIVALAAVLVGFSGHTNGEGGTGLSAGTTGSTTGATTGSSAGTAGTGGSTGGPPPGNQPWYPNMRIERVEEFKAQTTYTSSGSNTVVTPNQHVARVILQVGAPPSSPFGYTTVTYQGQPYNCPNVLDSYNYSVGVLTPGQMGPIVSGGTVQPQLANINTAWSTSPPPGGTFTTSPGMSVNLTAYGEIPIQVSAPGPFSPIINASFSVVVGLHETGHYIDPNTGQSHAVSQGIYAPYSLNLTEMPLSGSSIDTRRVYGVPNLGGELTADPNAPSRNVVFNPWIYNGGVFVGSVPYTSSSDQSGLSRTEMCGPGVGVGTCLAATATLLDMGARSYPSGAESVGIYIPNSNSGSSSNLSWQNAWGVNPSLTRGTPVDYSQTPVSTLTLSATNTTDYLNWFIADTNGSRYVIPTGVFSYLCFALTDETTGPSWHYFGSGTYSGIATTFPGTDSIPRIWWVGLVGYNPSNPTWMGPN